MSQRVALYLDSQNMYKGARRAFFPAPAPYTKGQYDPLKLGNLLCDRGPSGQERVLSDVRIYTGRPDPGKDPKGNSANLRQCHAWKTSGVEVIARSLRYPRNWPKEKEGEKGIDVRLAIDFVAGAIDDNYDIGIIASTDTDLVPALDFVVDRFMGTKWVEVVTWKGSGHAPRLNSKIQNIWCHYCNWQDFQSVEDLTDYAR